MKRHPFSKRAFHRKQAGDIIIESLVAMVLMATVGMGAVLVTSKVSSAQRDMRMHEIAVNKMRTAVIQHRMGLINACASFTLSLPSGENVEIAKQGCNGTSVKKMQVIVNGTAVGDIPEPLFLAARSESLGTIVVGGTWPDPFPSGDST